MKRCTFVPHVITTSSMSGMQLNRCNITILVMSSLTWKAWLIHNSGCACLLDANTKIIVSRDHVVDKTIVHSCPKQSCSELHEIDGRRILPCACTHGNNRSYCFIIVVPYKVFSHKIILWNCYVCTHKYTCDSECLLLSSSCWLTGCHRESLPAATVNWARQGASWYSTLSL